MNANKQLYKIMQFTVHENDDKEFGSVINLSYIFESKKDAFKMIKYFIKDDIKNNNKNIYYNIYPLQL